MSNGFEDGSGGFDWEQPEEFNEGGNRISMPGTYHFAVHDITSEDKDGGVLDGFRVTLEVLDGTVRDKNGCTEKGKSASVTFWNGKLSGKDGGRFARQKQAAFFVAANVLGPDDVASILAKKPRVDLFKAKGQQFVMTVEINDKGFVDPHFTDIFHVDDPKAAAFPKDADAMALIPKENRVTAEQLQAVKDAFAGKAASGNGSASNGNGATPQPAAAAAGVNLDDI